MYSKRMAACSVALFMLAGLSPASPALAQARTDVAVAAPWHVSGIDPSQDGYTFQRMQVGETLVEVDADGTLVPGLSSGWSASEDSLGRLPERGIFVP